MPQHTTQMILLTLHQLTCCVPCPIEAELYKFDKLFMPVTAMAAEL